MSVRDTWVDRLHGLLGVPPTFGNHVHVLRNGDEIFPAMLRAIDDAEQTVDLVTFVYWRGDIARRFAAALARAARRGCRVRVLLDAVGARKLDEHLVDTMRAAGCDVRWFRPIVDGAVPEIGEANHRTHRKVLVCDSSIGFTGGVGIADEWTGDARNADEWRDTHVEVHGPAVAGLQAAFVDNWADEHDDGFDPTSETAITPTAGSGGTTCLVVRGSSETGASDLRRLMLSLLGHAEQRVRVATAYFNPEDRLVEALKAAAARGVEVQILVPGPHADKRFVQLNGERWYEELMAAGIDMRSYEVSMMHAKVLTVDGLVATIGSANLNQRSMQHDEELDLVIVDPSVVAELDRHYDDDLRDTHVLDLDRWHDRGLLQRAGERVMSLVSEWL